VRFLCLRFLPLRKERGGEGEVRNFPTRCSRFWRGRRKGSAQSAPATLHLVCVIEVGGREERKEKSGERETGTTFRASKHHSYRTASDKRKEEGKRGKGKLARPVEATVQL